MWSAHSVTGAVLTNWWSWSREALGLSHTPDTDRQDSTDPYTMYGDSQEEQADGKNSFTALLVLELVLEERKICQVV